MIGNKSKNNGIFFVEFNLLEHNCSNAGIKGLYVFYIVDCSDFETFCSISAAANKLKLLLSFAVGGLLGDVFLHLLPEAWATVDKGEFA